MYFATNTEIGYQSQFETRQWNAEGKRRNEIAWFRFWFAGFRVSDKSFKHRNIDPKDARRCNMVVVDVRTSHIIDDCLLGPWERQYLIVIINKRQRMRPNQPNDELTITLYEPWKVDAGLPSMSLWASRRIEGNDCSDSSTEAPAWVNLFKLP